MTEIEQFKLLKQLLDCAEMVIQKGDIKYYQYHPIGFADMIANLDNPCSIDQVVNVITQFVESEIKHLEENK